MQTSNNLSVSQTTHRGRKGLTVWLINEKKKHVKTASKNQEVMTAYAEKRDRLVAEVFLAGIAAVKTDAKRKPQDKRRLVELQSASK